MLEILSELTSEQWTALGAIGTWIGGIGSAAAAGVAVGVAWMSSKAQQRQQQTYLAGLTPQLIPEVVKIARMAQDLEIMKGMHIHNEQALVYVKSACNIPISNRLVEMGAMGSQSLALAAGELVASAKLIVDNIDMAKLGGPKDHLSLLMTSNANLMFIKAITLAKVLKKEYPSASIALQAVLDMEKQK